jgi:pyruvate/2-oxoglutarate dehydrogenase complex dihydrolipoamide dehydrogenase (E3) component
MTRFLVDRDRRIIIGCTITGPDVAEFLHAVTIAIRPRGSARALAPRRSAVPHAQRALARAAGAGMVSLMIQRAV